MVLQAPDGNRQGIAEKGWNHSRKGNTRRAGDGDRKEDHPGILPGKVGGADEEKSN